MKSLCLSLAACAGLLPAADVRLEQAVPNIGDAIARTGIDRAWTTTAFGATYDASVIGDSDLDQSSVHARWTRNNLSLWGSAAFRVRSNPEIGETTEGFGDCEAGASVAMPFSMVMRGVAGLESVLGTSDDDALGGNATILRPFLAATMLARQNTTASLEFGYAFDATKEDDVEDTGLIDLRLTAISMLPSDAFAWARVVPAYDDEREDFTFTAAAGVGVLAGEHHTVRLDVTQPLDSDTRDREGWTLGLYYAWVPTGR